MINEIDLSKLIQALPKHYRDSINYLFGNDQLEQLLVLLFKLKNIKVELITSEFFLHAPSYHNSIIIHNHLFNLIRMGSSERTLLDNDYSLLKEQISHALKFNHVKHLYITLGFKSISHCSEFLLSKQEGELLKRQTIFKIAFVNAHISYLLLLLAHKGQISTSYHNTILFIFTSYLVSLTTLKDLFHNLFNRFKYLFLIITGWIVLSFGGHQELILSPAPEIYLPYATEHLSNLSSLSKFKFELFLSQIFIFMLYLFITGTFSLFIHNDKKMLSQNISSRRKLSTSVTAIYLLLLISSYFGVKSFFPAHTDSYSITSPRPTTFVAASKRYIKPHYTKEEEDYVLAQLAIAYKDTLGDREYQRLLSNHSRSIVQNNLKSDFPLFMNTYAIKKILDEQHISNNFKSYNFHRFTYIFWLCSLLISFIFLSFEIKYFSFKRANLK
ncbi:TPA: hypothetical protein ACGIK9_003424 [Acinetobacter baumannii]|uniref:hypothetical protein n=1 Tax=Acinetobacter baumannii TaxID=470 RepID=UPI00338FE460